MRVEELGFSAWDEALPNEGFGPFHTTEALRVLDDHASGELHLFGGFKGNEPVGLMPVFVRRKSIGQLVTSPPVGFGIGRLGPVLMPTSPKLRKQESENKEFVRKVIETTNADETSSILRISSGTRYTDPRPFQWTGFDLEPRFTYRLGLESTDPDELLKSFSRDLRNDIRSRDDVDITIQTRGIAGAREVYESMEERYREQGLGVPLSWGFVRDLLEALEDRARVYTAESDDGEFLSGMIVLYSADTVYNWKGGTKTTDHDSSVSLNSLLHWRIIEDALTEPSLESIGQYDFYTANNERLARYKSSFGGTLSPYYVIESGGVPLKVAKGVYRMAVLRKDPRGERALLQGRS